MSIRRSAWRISKKKNPGGNIIGRLSQGLKITAASHLSRQVPHPCNDRHIPKPTRGMTPLHRDTTPRGRRLRLPKRNMGKCLTQTSQTLCPPNTRHHQHRPRHPNPRQNGVGEHTGDHEDGNNTRPGRTTTPYS